VTGRRSADKLIGTLPAGSMIHKAPIDMQAKGVLYIASHPDHPPQLITPWGIQPLVLIPEPPPTYGPAISHSCGTQRR
jgi:hypothetical protein